MSPEENEPEEVEAELSLLMEAIMPKLVACRVREYQESDLEECLEMHRSNQPGILSYGTLDAFEEFLTLGTSYYLVVEYDGDVVACGGLELVGDTDTATLVHGMVHGDYHRRGFGTTLLAACIALLEPDGKPVDLVVRASRQAAAFFGRFGFRLHSVAGGADRGLLWLSISEQDVEDARLALEDRSIRIRLNDPAEEEEAAMEEEEER